MYTHITQLRVRYGETDQMGYLYYGNYALFYEVGRVEDIRNLGIVYKDIEKEMGLAMPVVEMRSRYLRPAHYDDLITIKTTVRKWPERSITFLAELFNEEGTLLNQGEVKLVFIDIPTGKRVDMPKPLLDLLQPYFNS